jgi:tetratricopeptide (TPR) repeat protein
VARLGVVVALVLALVATVTASLTSFYKHARASRAAAEYARGQELASAGKLDEALAHLRESLALERGRREYQLGLATLLLSAGRIDEADAYLRGVLRADPVSGRANVLGAQVARARGDARTAQEFYLRAVHGVWPAERVADRRRARIEFVQFLLDRGERERAAAELVEMRSMLPPDAPVLRLTIARLFVAAGDRAAAARDLRELTDTHPDDADAWALLSEVEFASGRYVSARSAGLRALGLRPNDAETTSRVALAAEALALDPTLKRLSLSERDRRSRRLLKLAVDALDRCMPDAPAPRGPVQAVRAEAQRVLAARAPVGETGETDARLSLTEQLWRARLARCPAIAPSERAIGVVLTAVSQAEARQ